MNILKEKLLLMADLARGMVTKSIRALIDKDDALSKEVIEVDEPKVNDLEIEIEESAISLIALHQPEASYLRTVMMVVKINNDLERIGDHAVNIANGVMKWLIPKPNVKPLIDLPRMGAGVTKMLSESIDAFIQGNAEKAINVCRSDSEIDNLLDQITRELITYMMSDSKTIDRALALILVARNLERIADLATNLAEDVIYMVKGEVIKHHRIKDEGEK
ncbi:MAG: phosphate signaling complex protein PhoU, partial [bacterium]